MPALVPRRAVLLTVGLSVLCATAGPLAAQTRDARIQGFVIDSVTRAPIPGVTVTAVAARRAYVSRKTGAFDVGPLLPGPDRLMLSKPGFRPRGFEFSIDSSRIATFNVGRLALMPAARVVVSLNGTLFDVDTGEPIPAGAISVNDIPVAVAFAGSFRVRVELPISDNIVRVDAPEYDSVLKQIWIDEDGSDVALQVAMRRSLLQLALEVNSYCCAPVGKDRNNAERVQLCRLNERG